MKPVLIILHGALGCKEQFNEWKNALDEQYDCRLIDFGGHGSRSGEETSFSIETFSEELKSYIKQNNLKNVNILGYSMGGYVALYAAMFTEGLIGNIMTVATKFDWNPETSKREAGYLQPSLMQTKVPQLVEQLIKHHGDLNWGKVVKKTAEMMLHLGENPLVTPETAAQIKSKVKFCVGDKDKMVSIAETFAVYQSLLGSCFCVFPNTVHLPEKMSIERIKFELLEFLSL